MQELPDVNIYIEPGVLRFVSRSSPGGCLEKDVGRYAWSMPSPDHLKLELISDQCPNRSEITPGDWIRSGVGESDGVHVLRTVAQRILEVSNADLCDVYRLDGDEIEILVAIGEDWVADPAGTRYPLTECDTFLKAVEQRRPVSCADILTDPASTPYEVEDARKWGYRESLDVPLISHGDVIGFISLMNRETRGFARQQVAIGLAQVASQAIANAGLYRQLDDNLRRMALVSESALELTSSLDLQATLLTTARRLCEGVRVNECEITVVEGDQLHTLMRVSDGEVDEAWMGQRLALADAAVTQEVIETKRPAVVGSLRDPRLTPAVHEINKDCELKSWATLPLIVKDRVIGTVELVESGAERTFTQAELDTAAAICHAAALAIDNAALFAREQQTTRETQLLNDIAARTDWPKIANQEGYLANLVQILKTKGYCARWDGKEMAVKNTSDWNEQFAVILSFIWIRRGEGMYRSTCYPSAF
jgi:GAF domain-containing protein